MSKSRTKEALFILIFLLAIFYLYIHTTYPAFKNNDSPETIASSFTLSIGHPPGYPLYMLAEKIFLFLPVANEAFRGNIFSAVLAVNALFVFFLILRRISFMLFEKENALLCAFCVFLSATSYLFWNQSIEAKGGIYMLNLLLIFIIIYFVLKLLEQFKSRYLYLIAYIYGISLANHWPSMVILLPFFLFLFIKFRKRVNMLQALLSFVFLFMGTSLYLYLPLRSWAETVMRWAKADTFQNFWWIVLRQGYVSQVKFGTDVLGYQLAEFFRLFFANYYFLWLLVIPGLYIIVKKSKFIFFFIGGMTTVDIIAVTFYNRTPWYLVKMMDVFLLPAEGLIAIFLAMGMIYFINILKNRVFIAITIALVLGLISFSAFKNYSANNESSDFISYDYGNNLLKTIDYNSMYFAEGDYNTMPVYYLMAVEKQRLDIKLLPVGNLALKWGMNEFAARFGGVSVISDSLLYNMTNIILNFSDKYTFYRNSPSSLFENIQIPLYQRQCGLLIKFSKDANPMKDYIYKIYSYRGIYDKFAFDQENIYLSSWYFVSALTQGNDFLHAGRYAEALNLYQKALTLPGEKQENEILFNMSLAYLGLKDEEKAIECLEKSISIRKDFGKSYEKLGLIFYAKKDFKKAKEMLDNAALLGANNSEIYDIINKIDNKQGSQEK